MFTKLPIWIAMLLVAALVAMPAFAQANTDFGAVWGSDQWLIDQFGVNGDITPFCNTISQKPDSKAQWEAEFPNLTDLCGSSQSQGSTPQGSTPKRARPQTTPQSQGAQPQAAPQYQTSQYQTTQYQ